MQEFKTMFGIWLLGQIFIFPFIIADFEPIELYIDFASLALMMIAVIGLKLIGI
jgi:hypothetical protein